MMRSKMMTTWTWYVFLSVGFAIAPAVQAGKGVKGGKPTPVENEPFALEWENYYFRSGVTGDCVGEDDDLEWLATGTLQPGESFTFTPLRPGCALHSAAITVTARWDAGALELSSNVPDADFASRDPEQVGLQVTARVVSNRAQLCMFPRYAASGLDYTITLTNPTTEPVHGIELHGRHENDWAVYFYARCLNADADGDGWNDSLEHSMANLLYPIGYIDGVPQPDLLWGSNYLRPVARSHVPGDEVDSFPPDVDDDGVVSMDDLEIIESHLGEGNGVALSDISPNQGEHWFWNNVLPFRRYDLDGDGWVTDGDVQIAGAYLDVVLPPSNDPVAPTARLTSHADGDPVLRGQPARLTAHAWDNAALTRVDYVVDGTVVCSRTNPEPSLGFESPLFSCWWDVPKKRGGLYTLAVRALDAEGNTGWSDTVTVQGH